LKIQYNRKITKDKDDSVNMVDAAAKGASEGLGLALNIDAMLIAFISLIALVNGMIGFIGGLIGIDGLIIRNDIWIHIFTSGCNYRSSLE